jgi:hypothetical protein
MAVETAAATLSIIASILSITRSVRELMQKSQASKEEALAHFRERANKAQKDILDRPGVTAAVLQMTIISPKLLKQLDDEAKECEQRHITARQDAGRDQGKLDQADIDAAQCMCAVLRAIKRYNTGKLPSGDFQNWWDSYRCQ